MICKPCRVGGQHTTQASIEKISGTLRRELQQAAKVWHGRCKGGTWCDCQCSTDASAINPKYRPQGGPA